MSESTDNPLEILRGYEEAHRLNPNCEQTRVDLGKVYFLIGNNLCLQSTVENRQLSYETALLMWTPAVDLLTAMPETQLMTVYRMALALHLMQRSREALQQIERAMFLHVQCAETGRNFYSVCESIFDPTLDPNAKHDPNVSAQSPIAVLCLNLLEELIPKLTRNRDEARLDLLLQFTTRILNIQDRASYEASKSLMLIGEACLMLGLEEGALQALNAAVFVESYHRRSELPQFTKHCQDLLEKYAGKKAADKLQFYHFVRQANTEAIALAEEALRRDRASIPLRQELAALYYLYSNNLWDCYCAERKADLLDATLLYLQRALEIGVDDTEPERTEMHYRLALALYEKDESAESFQILRTALHRHRGNASIDADIFKRCQRGPQRIDQSESRSTCDRNRKTIFDLYITWIVQMLSEEQPEQEILEATNLWSAVLAGAIDCTSQSVRQGCYRLAQELYAKQYIEPANLFRKYAHGIKD